jgi:hypothetical protein
MKKYLLLVVTITVMALTINLPSTGISGFLVAVGMTGFALAKEIMKTILTFILKALG